VEIKPSGMTHPRHSDRGLWGKNISGGKAGGKKKKLVRRMQGIKKPEKLMGLSAVRVFSRKEEKSEIA